MYASLRFNFKTYMKRISLFLSFCLLAGTFGMNAQTRTTSSIFDELQTPKAGKGKVTIHQSDAMRNLIGRRLEGDGIELTDSTAYLKIQGFRTQVFSGNDQRRSKDEAFKKEKEIKELFPTVTTYVSYNAPFWKLRVGDYRTHEEAYRMLRILMEAFPEFKKEMYIVKEEVMIPLEAIRMEELQKKLEETRTEENK